MRNPKIVSLYADIVVSGAFAEAWETLKIQLKLSDDKLAGEILVMALGDCESGAAEGDRESLAATIEHTIRTQRLVADRAAQLIVESEKALIDIRTCARVFRDELIAIPAVSASKREEV